MGLTVALRSKMQIQKHLKEYAVVCLVVGFFCNSHNMLEN